MEPITLHGMTGGATAGLPWLEVEALARRGVRHILAVAGPVITAFGTVDVSLARHQASNDGLEVGPPTPGPGPSFFGSQFPPDVA